MTVCGSFIYFCLKCNRKLFQIFKKYKTAFYFVFRFFVVYILLTLLYNLFLNSFGNAPDSITKIVAEQSRFFVRLFNFDAYTYVFDNEPFVRFYINNKYTVRVVEGCNAVSVYILFMTFIIAFRGNLKNTLIFLLGGAVLIYVMNIFRVVVITIGIYKYPEKEVFLHQVLFPVIIYGTVFLLWILWVNKFARKT